MSREDDGDQTPCCENPRGGIRRILRILDTRLYLYRARDPPGRTAQIASTSTDPGASRHCQTVTRLAVLKQILVRLAIHSLATTYATYIRQYARRSESVEAAWSTWFCWQGWVPAVSFWYPYVRAIDCTAAGGIDCTIICSKDSSHQMRFLNRCLTLEMSAPKCPTTLPLCGCELQC